MSEILKVCSECGYAKPLSDFRKRDKRSSVQKKCKVCERPARRAARARQRANWTEERHQQELDYAKRNQYKRKISDPRNIVTSEWIEKERERSRQKNKTEAYRTMNRRRQQEAREADPEWAKDKSVADYYRYQRKLPEPLVEAHVIVAKVKRVIKQKDGERRTQS